MWGFGFIFKRFFTVSSNDDDIFPPEHYEAIGRLIVACSRLDALYTDLICIFADMHVLNGIILVHHQQFSSKHDSMLAMLRKAGADSDDPTIDLLSKCRAVHDYRSSLVHGMWSKSETATPLSTRFSARGTFKRSRHERPTEEILEKAKEGAELAEQLSGLRDYLLTKDQEGGYDGLPSPPPSQLG